MYFEINVSMLEGGRYVHLFATHERSCRSQYDFHRVYREIAKQFAAPKFSISVTRWDEVGTPVDERDLHLQLGLVASPLHPTHDSEEKAAQERVVQRFEKARDEKKRYFIRPAKLSNPRGSLHEPWVVRDSHKNERIMARCANRDDAEAECAILNRDHERAAR